MIIFEIKINNETTYTVDTENYDTLLNYSREADVEILRAYEFVSQQFSRYVKDLCTLDDLLIFLSKYVEFEEDIESYYHDLDYPEEIQDIYDFMDFSDPEEFFNLYFYDNPYEAARATKYGDVCWMDNYIKFNAHGNLETCFELPFTFYQEDIIKQWLKENF